MSPVELRSKVLLLHFKIPHPPKKQNLGVHTVGIKYTSLNKKTGSVAHDSMSSRWMLRRRSVHLCVALKSMWDKVFLFVPDQKVPGQLGVGDAASILQVTQEARRTAVLGVSAALRPG